MARGGGFPGGGGANMQQMMRQAQKMQQEMQKVQEDLAQQEVEASSGGGAVKVVVGGDKLVKSIEIQEAVVDPDDIEMLQDLVQAAVNQALTQMEELSQKAMSRFTGGMNLGGLF